MIPFYRDKASKLTLLYVSFISKILDNFQTANLFSMLNYKHFQNKNHLVFIFESSASNLVPNIST